MSESGTEHSGRVCLDLFSGLGGRRDEEGGFSGAFQRADDWRVVTVDIAEEFDPDICADITELEPGDLPDSDVVLASPPCPDFSVACITDKWSHSEERRPKHLPRKQQVAESVKTVFHTLWLVQELQPDWWFMENPQGMLRTWIGDPVSQVHYCQYGEDFKKPTDLWGRHPPMEYRRCPGKPACDHVSNPREVNTFRDDSRTRAVDGSNSAERAKIPAELSEAILQAVESAYENPPPEQSKLMTDGGTEQTTIEETTVTVVEETSAHRTFEVPASDVGEDEVSLANAELDDEVLRRIEAQADEAQSKLSVWGCGDGCTAPSLQPDGGELNRSVDTESER